jgi:hypothetical protein
VSASSARGEEEEEATGTTSTSRTGSTTLQKQMDGWAIERFGDPRRERALLSLEKLPVPKVEKHDVLIRMYGAEIGDWDALVASGEWSVERSFPIVLGLAGSGTVVAVGKDVVGAVQLASRRGAHVVAIARRQNHAFLRDLGAEVLIDYAEGDFVDVGIPDGLDRPFRLDPIAHSGEQARSWVTPLTEDMGDRRSADMGDTRAVFDVLASEMVSTTLSVRPVRWRRQPPAEPAACSARPRRGFSARQLSHSRPARHRRPDEAEVGPQVVDEAESDIREEDVVEAVGRLDPDRLSSSAWLIVTMALFQRMRPLAATLRVT